MSGLLQLLAREQITQGSVAGLKIEPATDSDGNFKIAFKVENSGKIKVMVGSSSRDIRLTGEFTISKAKD